MINHQNVNRLVIVGNGFDLAHGLPTSYKNFLDWYVCDAFDNYRGIQPYEDSLITISPSLKGAIKPEFVPKDFKEAIYGLSKSHHKIEYKSSFFKRILDFMTKSDWIDIERLYYGLLKGYFTNNSYLNKKEIISKLNHDFDSLIEQLTRYLKKVNETIVNVPKLEMDTTSYNLGNLFTPFKDVETKFLNFNYTDTLSLKEYSSEEDVIHIHGRVSDLDANPIIFGYGDETDSVYQNIEDTGENFYLEHIKSFGYFKTNNYHRLLSYLDSAPYSISIVGHSCGLSDRVLLNEICENENCKSIEIFYYQNKFGVDNFKEITQQLSRHFKPQNKNLMRRKLLNKNHRNIIPQNANE